MIHIFDYSKEFAVLPPPPPDTVNGVMYDHLVIAPSGTRWFIKGEIVTIEGGKTFTYMPNYVSKWYGIKGKTKISADIVAWMDLHSVAGALRRMYNY